MADGTCIFLVNISPSKNGYLNDSCYKVNKCAINGIVKYCIYEDI